MGEMKEAIEILTEADVLQKLTCAKETLLIEVEGTVIS
jgi:hypothetical protein